MPTHIGEWELEYESKEEERLFKQSRRLSGFHVRMVKACFPEEAYKHILGGNWVMPEPKGRGQIGNWGMGLRYACIDPWFREEGFRKRRFTEQEVEHWMAQWGGTAFRTIPLSHLEILDFWRENRKNQADALATNKRKIKNRRTASFEKRFNAEREPGTVYRQIRSTIPNPSAVDDQLLRQMARLIANANDLLFQAERMKGVEETEDVGDVPVEQIQDYAKIMDLSIKVQKQALDLMKQHGYDYQARRKRREAQTAAEVIDDFKDEAAALFDELAIEWICPQCQLSLGYFIRHFPTIEYKFIVPKCPRCGNSINETMEALVDEVMGGS
jgi:rubrerythrin